MKKIAILLSIFLTSLLCEPIMAATASADQVTSELIGGGYKIKKKRKFKTNRKKRRGLRTCLNKKGCKKHKLFKSKKKSCNTY